MMKRYIAEFIGTFMIVFAPVALAASSKVSGVDQGLLVAAFASGLPVLAMIYAVGSISAAHFNPAVTLGFAISKRFPWKYVLPYWLSQLAGSLAAAGLVALLFGSGAGAHIPAHPELILRNVGTEVVLSFVLMFVIISVATDKRVSPVVPALAIGFTVVFCVLVGGPVTGGSMNPARSFGPALFAGSPAIESYWLYLVGPMIGTTTAAMAFEGIRMGKENACSAPTIAD